MKSKSTNTGMARGKLKIVGRLSYVFCVTNMLILILLMSVTLNMNKGLLRCMVNSLNLL